eukprot:m.65819 g.65819  ORF g.65819 m.65819 type:complete len:73 (+) comp35329_c0_seq6:352-570(+)
MSPDTAQLKCKERNGRPADHSSLLWWHNVTASSRVHLVRNVLTITKAIFSDAGIYECGIGSSKSSSARITVI